MSFDARPRASSLIPVHEILLTHNKSQIYQQPLVQCNPAKCRWHASPWPRQSLEVLIPPMLLSPCLPCQTNPDADPSASVADVPTGLSCPRFPARLQLGLNLAIASATADNMVATFPTNRQSSCTRRATAKYLEEMNQPTAKSKKSNSKKADMVKTATKSKQTKSQKQLTKAEGKVARVVRARVDRQNRY